MLTVYLAIILWSSIVQFSSVQVNKVPFVASNYNLLSAL